MATRRHSHPIPRALYNVLGLTFVGLGIAGYILPVMPGTIFMILALCCFKRGSARFENWLLEHPRLGPTLRDWELHRSIKPRTKVLAIVMIWACIGLSMAIVRNPWVDAMLLAIALALTWFLASRKSATSAVRA